MALAQTQTQRNASACNVQLIQSGSHSVIVSNVPPNQGQGQSSSKAAQQSSSRHLNSLAGLVVATPLTGQVQVPPLISKILLKACISRGNNKDSKTFTLRNINISVLNTVEKLRRVIQLQLKSDILQSKGFEVGYMQGSTVVSIRSQEDLSEVWANIKKGTIISLWCDGLKKLCPKRVLPHDLSDSEDEQEICRNKKRKKDDDREDKVGATIKQLKKQHGDCAYTPMQYRVWAEMIVGGVHASTDNSPTSIMFIRAGVGTKKKSDISYGTSVTGPGSTGPGSSPAKIAASVTNSCQTSKTCWIVEYYHRQSLMKRKLQRKVLFKN